MGVTIHSTPASHFYQKKEIILILPNVKSFGSCKFKILILKERVRKGFLEYWNSVKFQYIIISYSKTHSCVYIIIHWKQRNRRKTLSKFRISTARTHSRLITKRNSTDRHEQNWCDLNVNFLSQYPVYKINGQTFLYPHSLPPMLT